VSIKEAKPVRESVLLDPVYEPKDHIVSGHSNPTQGKPGTQRLQASFLLLLATIGWGISFPLIKASALLQQETVPDASSWFIAALTIATRFCGGALILLVLCLRTLRQLTRGEALQGLGVHISFLNTSTHFISTTLSHTSLSSHITFINY
jgi:drug/metabolite transporter (DMT)-like permease